MSEKSSIFDLINKEMGKIDSTKKTAEKMKFNSVFEQRASFLSRLIQGFVGIIRRSSTFSTNLVEISSEDINDRNQFMEQLDKRNINMNHRCITQRRNNNSVFAVIIGVRKTETNLEIKRNGNNEGKMSLDIKEINVSSEISNGDFTMFEVPPQTPLGYTVLEMKINKENGAIEPLWGTIESGGFISEEKTGEDKESYISWTGMFTSFFTYLRQTFLFTGNDGSKSSTVRRNVSSNTELMNKVRHCSHAEDGEDKSSPKEVNPLNSQYNSKQDRNMPNFCYLEDQLKPLKTHLQGNDSKLKVSLRKLMTCHTDVVLLSKMLNKAEVGDLREQNVRKYGMFHNIDEVEMILELAGVQTKTDDQVYESEVYSILKAVAYLFDAMCDVEEIDLNKISQCTEIQIKALEKILKEAISFNMKADISIEPELNPALEKPAKDILKDMNFGVPFYGSRIRPPSAHTEVHECIYCILYCFS